MMKLIAFRIRNFRSIVDTGWQNISQDNITCLIGQNESGKTSVLEGLKVFYSGIISEDVLRSDLSLPEVSCRFNIPDGWLLKVTENPGTELKELLSGLTHIELTRNWIADLSSVISVGGEISQYLDSLENAWRIYLDDVAVMLDKEMSFINDLKANLKSFEVQETEIRSKLPVVEVKRRGFLMFFKRYPEPANQDNPVYHLLMSELKELAKRKEEISGKLSEKRTMRKSGELWTAIQDKYNILENHLVEISKKLEERHQRMTLLMRPSDNEDDLEWKNVLNDFRKTREERDLKKVELDRQIAFSGYLMEGCTEADAERKVNEIIQSYKSRYNTGILGKKYFEYCPVFEMFEDFGSLLPNRIDMEDILNGNMNVEGFKAARNFLSIAQLDYSFFQQPSSRILKQKIENLNNTLTINFHDFWQQSIGLYIWR
jgi:hypothetical protein